MYAAVSKILYFTAVQLNITDSSNIQDCAEPHQYCAVALALTQLNTVHFGTSLPSRQRLTPGLASKNVFLEFSFIT